MLYPNIPKEILMDPVNEESVKNVFYDFLIQKKRKERKGKSIHIQLIFYCVLALW